MELPGSNPLTLALDRARTGADDARLKALGERGDRAESREGLEETAHEFEAVFLNQLMQAMRNTIPENDLFNSGGPTKFYQQMHDAEMANALASSNGGLGIADLIVQQFATNVEAREKASGAPTAAPAAPQPEVFGPPAPAALERYRGMGPVAGRVAEMARLRRLAVADGQATADTLSRFGPEIGAAAGLADLEPSLILAVVMEESGGDPLARSPKGATGLMQLMPATAAEVGVEDSTSPAQNLQGGAEYLARMSRRYPGRLDLALAAYNAGPGNVDRAGRAVPDFPETQRYVQKVLQRYRALGGGTELANTGQ